MLLACLISFFSIIHIVGGTSIYWEYIDQYLTAGLYADHPLGGGDGTDNRLLPLLIRRRGNQVLLSGKTTTPYSKVLIHYSQFVGGHVRWSQQAELRPNPPTTASSGFGDHTIGFDIAGRVAFVGCANDDAQGVQSGSAFIYTGYWTKWTQQQKLFPKDPSNYKKFGISVDNQANYALIGASGEGYVASSPPDPGTGAVYAFVLQGQKWTQTQKLLLRGAESADGFGSRVRVYGNTAIISAPATGKYCCGYGGAGAVHVYTMSSLTSQWTFQQSLRIPNAGPNGQVGLYTDIYANYIVIGSSFSPYDYAPPYMQSYNHVGQAFIYKTTKNGIYFYSEQQVLAVAGTTFYGVGVQMFDRYLFVGAQGADFEDISKENGGAGATYVYYHYGSAWSQLQILHDPYYIYGQYCNPYVYGTKAFVTASYPIAGGYTLGQNATKCLIISVGDQFGDGWDAASLQSRAPDGSLETYAPFCDSTNPLTFEYCPLSPTADCGIYTFNILNATNAMFPWEIYWTVKVEGSSMIYRGDHSTSMKFYYNCSSRSFSFISGTNLVNNRTCHDCPLKPPPKPKPIPIGGDPHTSLKKDTPVLVNGKPVIRLPPKGVVVGDNHQDGSVDSVVPPSKIAVLPVPRRLQSDPSSEPTTMPVLWPTLNSSEALDWHWLNLYDADNDGWFEPDGTGTAYYIMDSTGKQVLRNGTLCPGQFIHQCWQPLDEGVYILRVGGALDLDRGEHTWSFCGKTGGAQTHLVFRVYREGDTQEYDYMRRLTIGTNSDINPVKIPPATPNTAANPNNLGTPSTPVQHVPIPRPPPPEPPPPPSPPKILCEVLLEFSRKKYCADSTKGIINLKGQIILYGVSNDTVLNRNDGNILGEAIGSLVPGIKARSVTIDSTYFTEGLPGPLVTFTLSVDGDSGYNFHYYNEMEYLAYLIKTALTTGSKFTSAVVHYSLMDVSGSVTLRDVTGIHLLELQLSEVNIMPRTDVAIPQSESKDKKTLTLASDSVSHEDSIRSEGISGSAASVYSSFGALIGLTLIVAFIFYVRNRPEGETMKTVTHAQVQSSIEYDYARLRFFPDDEYTPSSIVSMKHKKRNKMDVEDVDIESANHDVIDDEKDLLPEASESVLLKEQSLSDDEIDLTPLDTSPHVQRTVTDEILRKYKNTENATNEVCSDDDSNAEDYLAYLDVMAYGDVDDDDMANEDMDIEKEIFEIDEAISEVTTEDVLLSAEDLVGDVDEIINHETESSERKNTSMIIQENMSQQIASVGDIPKPLSSTEKVQITKNNRVYTIFDL